MFFSTQKTFDTEKLVHTDCTEKFLHTDFFCTQKLLPNTVFTQQKRFRTETFTHQKQICTTIFTDRWFLHTENSPHRSLTHRRFYAQHFLHTDAFTHNYFLHRHKLHTKTCAHNTRLHTANFCTERFCFPFLITYLSCSPSQVRLTESLPKIGGAAKAHRAEQTIATSRWFAGKPSVETGETQAG